MKRQVACLLAITAIPHFASATSILDLAWLSGCWAASSRDTESREQWMPPSGGTMFGMSRTVRNSKTVAFEFMQIIEDDYGGIVFIAAPSGQSATSFLMVSVTDREVIFENPDHDFPQRVIYRLMSDEKLIGRIEGTVDGMDRALDFPMRKIACGSGQPDS